MILRSGHAGAVETKSMKVFEASYTQFTHAPVGQASSLPPFRLHVLNRRLEACPTDIIGAHAGTRTFGVGAPYNGAASSGPQV